MNTRRDVVMLIIIITWLLANFISAIFAGSTGIMISNIIYMVIFGFITIASRYFEDFKSWLNIKINCKHENTVRVNVNGGIECNYCEDCEKVLR